MFSRRARGKPSYRTERAPSSDQSVSSSAAAPRAAAAALRSPTYASGSRNQSTSVSWKSTSKPSASGRYTLTVLSHIIETNVMSPYRLAERCGYEPMPSSRKVASPSARATLSASSSAANTTTARVSMPRAAAEQRQLASRSVTPPLIAITTTVPPPCRAALASVGRSAWLIASSRASSAASIESGLSPLAVDERGLGGTGVHTCVR